MIQLDFRCQPRPSAMKTVPNAETIAAIEELERGGGKSFDSIEELMAELNADD